MQNNAPTETTTIRITRSHLEPGTHLFRRPTETIFSRTIEIPTAEISGTHPEYGIWTREIITFSAIERALHARGELYYIGESETWTIRIEE
jgi:hypothetical protein